MDGMRTCPCCRQSVEDSGLTVDLNTNRVTTDLGSAQLGPREAEITAAILKQYPAPLPTQRLVVRVYGLNEDLVHPENNLKVTIHRLRKKLEPLGYTIRSTVAGYSSMGYRLMKYFGPVSSLRSVANARALGLSV
jgi:DNA-binding response OmpR family regulator